MDRYRWSYLLAVLVFGAGTAVWLLSTVGVSSQTLPDGARAQPDTIIAEVEPSITDALARLEAGTLDIYAQPTGDAAIAAQIEASPNLAGYYNYYGPYDELTFNPSGPVFAGTGKLNPFAVPRVRQAMNYLVDRDHIAQAIYGGMAVPRWHALNPASSDYAALADVAHGLEMTYAYNKALATQMITQEMVALGATKVNGLWHYGGAPVEIILLIRIEDNRLAIGDYLGDQLEDLGFTVIRDYRDAASASPIWLTSDPADGLFHIYTGSWITTRIPRDLAGNFAFFYTDMGLSFPLWQAYVNTPEFYELARQLADGEFASPEQRQQMMAQALHWALQDSVRVWLVDRLSITPRRAEVSYTAGLYGGLAASQLWPHTLSGTGSSLTMATPQFLNSPWNPLNGSNWLYDLMLIRATGDSGTISDPYTGLAWPQRVLTATVVVQEGLPVSHSLPWVALQFAPVIEVPGDAWVDWDASEQRFLTAAEVYTEPQTAWRKSTVYYPADLYDAVTWHDGSPFSVADVVLNMILTFDRAKEESTVYDASQVGAYNTFMYDFKGMRLVSEDPLVIEHYSNAFGLDAELSLNSWWPFYTTGPGAWHNLALGLLVEADGDAAFSWSKADDLGVPWLDYLRGPGLDLLADQLALAQTADYIPYAPTLGDYITTAEAAARWDKLADWYAVRDHFWLGTGPYYLEAITTDPQTVTLQRFADYPDPPDRWNDFLEPLIPQVVVSGPENIVRGEEAIYDIQISFGGQPYSAANLESVRYFVFGANGQVVLNGHAEPVDDGLLAQNGGTAGLWRVLLDGVTTSQLPGGPNRLEIVVVSNRVVIPVFSSQPVVLPYDMYLPLIGRNPPASP